MRGMSLLLIALAFLAGCPCPAPPFLLEVVPEEIGDAIPDQRCVFLVRVEQDPEEPPLAEPVRIKAAAIGGTVMVEHADIVPGEVAEVTVMPLPLSCEDKDRHDGGRTVSALIRGQYGACGRTVRLPVSVTSEEADEVLPMAAEVRGLFVPWLEAHHPELGITTETEWTGTIVTPHILVVTHYLFFSSEWELHVFWHVMIPPHDWARIELRRRFVETLPSLAFEIPSRSAQPPLEAVAIEPSDTLWR